MLYALLLAYLRFVSKTNALAVVGLASAIGSVGALLFQTAVLVRAKKSPWAVFGSLLTLTGLWTFCSSVLCKVATWLDRQCSVFFVISGAALKEDQGARQLYVYGDVVLPADPIVAIEM